MTKHKFKAKPVTDDELDKAIENHIQVMKNIFPKAFSSSIDNNDDSYIKQMIQIGNDINLSNQKEIEILMENLKNLVKNND